MARFRGSVRTAAATAATANTAAVVLWNPHASVRVRLYEISWFKTNATADFVAIVRASARGTQTTTLASAQANETDYAIAPPSGLTMDTVWTTQPTLLGTGNPMFRISLPGAVGSGFMLPLGEELEIPPAAGLAFITPVATALQPADVNIAWAE